MPDSPYFTSVQVCVLDLYYRTIQMENLYYCEYQPVTEASTGEMAVVEGVIDFLASGKNWLYRDL